MKEKVLSTLNELGFVVLQLDDSCYEFEYEGFLFLYIYSDDDNFLNLSIPNVVEKSDCDEDTFNRMLEFVNSNMKYVKAYTMIDGIGLFYERELIDEVDLEKVIHRMILCLDSAARRLLMEMKVCEGEKMDSIGETYNDDEGYGRN